MARKAPPRKTRSTGSRNSVIDRVALAVADGAIPDWDDLDKQSSPAERQLLEQLRALSAFAHTTRSSRPRRSRRHPLVEEPAPPRSRTREVTRPAVSERWPGLTLVEEVGQGAFGIVYRAHDPRLDRPVALKMLRRTFCTNKELVARLLHEGRTLARINHAN